MVVKSNIQAAMRASLVGLLAQVVCTAFYAFFVGEPASGYWLVLAGIDLVGFGGLMAYGRFEDTGFRG